MQFSPRLSGELGRVKLEPRDTVCVLGADQVRQQHCRESTSGGDSYAGMCDIKEEPADSDEHPIVEVKTEPYNVALLAEHDQMGHKCDSTSEGTTASTGMLHVKDEFKDIYHPVSPACNSSNTRFNISTTTVRPPLNNTVSAVNGEHIDSKPIDIPPDQRETQEVCEPPSLTSDHQGNRERRCSVRLASRIDTGRVNKVQIKTCSAKESTTTHQVPAPRARAERHVVEGLHKCKACTFECSSQASLEHHMVVHECNASEQHPFVPNDETGAKSLGRDPSPDTSVQSGSAKNRTDEESRKKQRRHKKTHKCHLCPTEFTRAHLLKDHIRTHTGEKPYKCGLCPARFSKSSSRWRHQKTHTRVKTHRCDLCPAEFGKRANMLRHRQTHTGEKPYKCDLCPAGYRYCTDLSRHKWTHAVAKTHKCSLCPYEFARPHLLEDHMRTHTGEKPYKCDLCPARFRQNSGLHTHKKGHAGDKPCRCDLCPAEFSRRPNMLRHRRTHTGEKPYKCDLCPAEYVDSTNLLRHRRTHTGEKPHKCDLCPAEFISGAKLQRHKRIHTGERPYKCDLCPAECRQKADLQRHKLTHAANRTYKCNMCPAEYNYVLGLRRHKLTHQQQGAKV